MSSFLILFFSAALHCLYCFPRSGVSLLSDRVSAYSSVTQSSALSSFVLILLTFKLGHFKGSFSLLSSMIYWLLPASVSLSAFLFMFSHPFHFLLFRLSIQITLHNSDFKATTTQDFLPLVWRSDAFFYTQRPKGIVNDYRSHCCWWMYCGHTFTKSLLSRIVLASGPGRSHRHYSQIKGLLRVGKWHWDSSQHCTQWSLLPKSWAQPAPQALLTTSLILKMLDGKAENGNTLPLCGHTLCMVWSSLPSLSPPFSWERMRVCLLNTYVPILDWEAWCACLPLFHAQGSTRICCCTWTTARCRNPAGVNWKFAYWVLRGNLLQGNILFLWRARLHMAGHFCRRLPTSSPQGV